MSVHLEVFSEGLFLAAPDFPAALAELHRLAKRLPNEFGDPEKVLEAPDLVTALEGDHWTLELDAEGNITALEYGGQTPSGDSTDWWPEYIMYSLAPPARRGIVRVLWEGDPMEQVWRFSPGKVRLTRRKRRPREPKPPPAAAGAPVEYRPLPEDASGIAWHIRVPFADGLPDDRPGELAAVVVRSLAATGWWAEFEALCRRREGLLSGTPALDAEAAAAVVREAWRYGVFTLTRPDASTAVSLQASERDLVVRAWAADGAVARLGAAAIEGIVDVAGRLSSAGGADLGPVRGYARPVSVRPPVFPDVSSSADRWPQYAMVDLVDRRRGNDEDLEVAGAALPEGADRYEAGDITAIRWARDGVPEALALACERRARWLADHVASTPLPRPAVRRGADYEAPDDEVEAPDALVTFEACWRFLDLSQWDLQRGRIARIIEEVARTPLWPALVGRRRRMVEKVTAAMTAPNAMRWLDSGDAWLYLPDGEDLQLSLTLRGPQLDTFGPRSVDAFLSLVLALRQAFRGRAELRSAHVKADGVPYRRMRPARSGLRYPLNAVVDIVDPHLVEDDDSRDLVRETRVIAATPPPAGATREIHDGLVVLRWLNDPSDPAAVAWACAAHERWITPLIGTEPAYGHNELGDAEVQMAYLTVEPFTACGDGVGYLPVGSGTGGPDESAFEHAVRLLTDGGLPASIEQVGLIAPARRSALDLLPRAREAGFARVVYPAAPEEETQYWDPDPPGLWQ